MPAASVRVFEDVNSIELAAENVNQDGPSTIIIGLVTVSAFEGAGGASRDLMRVEPALISAEGVGKVSKSRSKMVVERLRVVPLSLNDFDQGGEAASCRRGQLQLHS